VAPKLIKENEVAGIQRATLLTCKNSIGVLRPQWNKKTPTIAKNLKPLFEVDVSLYLSVN